MAWEVGRDPAAGRVSYHFTFAVPHQLPVMSFIQTNWYLILALVVSGALLVWPLIQRRLSPVTDIGTLEVTRLINSANAVLVDVRETKEFEGGRLPKAVHIPLSQLDGRSAELAKLKDRPVVAYCMSGTRSSTAAKILARAGFKDIYQLRGGYRAWKDAGLPVEK
jgi:rhodanese-related sulfurtransferase